MCDNEGSIKGALVEVINALMSALPNERKLAEQQLDALQVTEGKFQLYFFQIEGIISILLRIRNETFLFSNHFLSIDIFTEYGVALTELTLEQNGILQVRQMAALLLKQYVDTHWTSCSEKFKGPETSPAAKATIRSMLPHGLRESISKVRKKEMQNCNNHILKVVL